MIEHTLTRLCDVIKYMILLQNLHEIIVPIFKSHVYSMNNFSFWQTPNFSFAIIVVALKSLFVFNPYKNYFATKNEA